MKPKYLLFLFLLGFSRLSPTVSSIDESNVASYEVERRSSESDLFHVNMKNVSQCTSNDWCETFGLTFPTGEANSCGCTCAYSHSSFLPSLRKCLTGNQLLANFGGCPNGTYQNLFGAVNYPVFQTPVSLTSKMIKTTSVEKNQLNCSLYGYFFDYSGFKPSWKCVFDGIFELKKRGTVFEIEIEDKSNKLSGRVIKLNLMCTNKTQKVQPVSQACYLFKVVGHVKYYASARTSSVHAFQTSVDYHTSSFAHPSSPSLQLPQSTQITSMSSLSHLASLPSPSSSLDVMTRISTTRTADYAPTKKSSVHTFQTSVGYHTSSSFAHASSLSPQLPQSTQITSTSSLSRSASLPSPSPSLDVMTRIQTTHTGKFSHMGTRSLQTRPALRTSRSILPLTLNAEVESLLSVSSEEVTNQVIYTGIHTSSVNTGEPNYSEPSELLITESSLPPVDGPGDKEARKSGKDKGVAIGGGVGGAVVFGIIVIGLIIVFCRRRKLRENMEKKEKLHVEVNNPVYEKPQDDIKMERPREKATDFSEQDSQLTYLEPVDNKGYENYGALYSTADENYDNSSVYQSLDKNTPAVPQVYQSLQNNQPSTKKPIPKQEQSNAEKPGKPSVPPDPVYNVLEEAHTRQGNTSEAIYNVLEGPDPGHDTPGNIQDPVYNVLDGPGVGQTYEAPDVGVQQDPLYNVLEVPESKQEHQEPLYNVLESADTENAPSRQDGFCDGAASEPLYNVLDGADSSGANSSGAEYAAPNRNLSADGHDNPAYEQTLEFGAPHALVDSPGSQRESLYEPLKGSDRQDVYEPLHKKGK